MIYKLSFGGAFFVLEAEKIYGDYSPTKKYLLSEESRYACEIIRRHQVQLVRLALALLVQLVR